MKCPICNELIVFTSMVKKCTNSACGVLMCFMCATKNQNSCPRCGNPVEDK